MQLHQSTWQEIQAYLTSSTGIIVPIGSTEQHGPTGLLGTDAICPEVIAEKAGARANILIAPTFSVGCAQHHMAFPGSMTLRPATMIAVIVDWVTSFARHGFERIYFLNGHGGNVDTVRAAFSEIYAASSLKPNSSGASVPKCHLQNWWELEGVFKLCKDLFPKGHGGHATPSEVSVTYFAYPEAVKTAKLEPKIAPSGPFYDADDYRRRFPDGRIGSDPSLASPKHGEVLIEKAADSLIKSYTQFVES